MSAINDYECGACGAVLRDIVVRGTSDVPSCCGGTMQWLPSLGHGGVSSLKGFEYNGIPVTSLRQAQAIERDTAQQAADGVPGAAPIRFRAPHQNASNMGVNTFGPPPDQSIPVARRGAKRYPVRALKPSEVPE